MADLIDFAQAAQLRDTDIAIREQLRYKSLVPSNGICEECGTVIPPARVKAINATTCIDCARELERWS